MSAMANILVKDDASTPVEQTLVPVTDTPAPFWRGQISGVPFEGQPRLYFTEEKVKSGAYKRTVKLEVPVMETLGAAGSSSGYVAPPKVAFVETHIHTYFSDGRATIADRANSTKMMVGILQGAGATTATGLGDQSLAGDAWKAIAQPGPLFMIYGQIPY